MDMIERLSVKLLARCTREIAAAAAECLCQEPDRRLIGSMIDDVRAMLDEFEAAYLDEEQGCGMAANSPDNDSSARTQPANDT